jgi:hypothetical protein
MSNLLRAALIGAALLAPTSAVFALEGLDGDGNPVPNNAAAYAGSSGYVYDAPYAQMGPGVPLRSPTRAERRALSRGQEVR